jgi:Domain of unknown function (DUF4350)
MRQKLFIFIGLILVIGALIGINAVSYTQKDIKPDTELEPNRSTFNSGATGTRAFYDLLGETGKKITRWQEKPSVLLNNSANNPQTFVIIGRTRLEIDPAEVEQILTWVANGGKLVIIDRDPPKDLLSTTTNWSISNIESKDYAYEVDPYNQPAMVLKTDAGKPLQPTVFTKNVNAIQPSRFASSVKLEFFEPDPTTKIDGISVQATKNNGVKPTPTPFYSEDEDYDEPPPLKTPIQKGIPPKAISTPKNTYNEVNISSAPFVHIASKDKNLLVDFPYGAGQIVYLTDPYIITNAGISLVDNAQLAMNVVSSRDGLIAFDEYHQGYGISNPIFDYFEGTPFISIVSQLLLLAAVIFFTNSRRFARPLPVDEPNRLSKLEYISAMAQLQENTRAYDLAIENIYTEFRRSVARHFGVDNYTTSRKDLAALIAERTKYDRQDLENLMSQCENIIHGEPTNKREVLQLTSRLREIEEKLNLKRKRKEAFKK